MEIRTLIPDIQKLVTTKGGWFTPELAQELGTEIASVLGTQFNTHRESGGRLRLSKLGPTCPCALWYSYHHPELAEKMPPWAEVKFAFGHIVEALAITLAKASGHEVTGEQDELVVDQIVGHRDCVIDGCLVDVKSMSSIGFGKLKTVGLSNYDPFGYTDQLDGYLLGSADDPLVRVKDRAYILAIDKILGHMYLYEHRLREAQIRARIKEFKQIVALNQPPACTCETLPDGKSGNLRLDTKASYSAYKYCCHPNLRTFLYASGPVYLTKVVRKPDVVEIDKFGNMVYN